MRPPPFLKVAPTDIGRVGALGACILALVRYVTALPGESNGRRIIEGEMWWRASHNRISQALGGGISRRTVSSTVNKLLETGELQAISRPDFYGDRAQLYRASDLPLADSADRLADIANLPSTEELEEHSVGESVRTTEDEPLDVEPVPDHSDAPPPLDSSSEEPQPLDAGEVEPPSRELVTQRIDSTDAIVGEVVDDDPDPEPQPYCDRHMPHGTDTSCGACGRRRRIREKWEQRQQARVLRGIFSKAAEPAPPVRRRPESKPEPPLWIPGPHGPRCRTHGHLKVAPAECTRCRDAAIAAEASA